MTREELIEIIKKAGLPSFNNMYVIVEIEEIAKLADLIIEAFKRRTQKEWQDLTHEEFVEVFNTVVRERPGYPDKRISDFAKYISKALKAKNQFNYEQKTETNL